MSLKLIVDDAIRSLEKVKEALPEKRDVGSHWSDYPLQFSYVDWDCKDSPTGYCMYTNHEYDSCIFCYEPDERK